VNAQSEVELYVREAVARTGKPCLLPPPDARHHLVAIPLAEFGGDDDGEGIWTVFLGPDLPETDDEVTFALRVGHDTARQHSMKERVEGVRFCQFETSLGDYVRRVEATALGLSLLQLALNRSGSQFALHVWGEWA
jgi:hypothetical protein